MLKIRPTHPHDSIDELFASIIVLQRIIAIGVDNAPVLDVQVPQLRVDRCQHTHSCIISRSGTSSELANKSPVRTVDVHCFAIARRNIQVTTTGPIDCMRESYVRVVC